MDRMMSNVWIILLGPSGIPVPHGSCCAMTARRSMASSSRLRLTELSGSLVGGNNYGVMLRYAGEHNGFRIAAGAGFEHIGDVYTNQSTVFGIDGHRCHPARSQLGASTCLNGSGAATSTAGANAQSLSCKTPDINAWGVGLSAMHIHTGLFLQGAIQGVEYNNAGSSTTAYWGETCGASTAGGSIVALCNSGRHLQSQGRRLVVAAAGRYRQELDRLGQYGALW